MQRTHHQPEEQNDEADMVLPTAEEFDQLPVTQQDKAYAQVAALEASLRARLLTRHEGQPQPDRAVLIEEAAQMLGATRDHLYRHWAKLGGYKDQDGHVKFSLATIQGHIQGQGVR